MVSEMVQGKQSLKRRPLDVREYDVNRSFTYIEAAEPKRIDTDDVIMRSNEIVFSMWKKLYKTISHDESASRYVEEAYKGLRIEELSTHNTQIASSWKKMASFIARIAKIFDSACEYAEFPRISISDDSFDLYWRYGEVNLLINFPCEGELITFHGINSRKEEFMGSFSEVPIYIVESMVEWLKQEWNGR